MPTSVSRAAGIALTKAMSHDLAKDNILVNTVCIGHIKSAQVDIFIEEHGTNLEELFGVFGGDRAFGAGG